MIAPYSNIHQDRSQHIPQKVRESFSFIHQPKKVFKLQYSTEDTRDVSLTTQQSASMTQPQHTTDKKNKTIQHSLEFWRKEKMIL